jgi:aquaporin Z
MKFLALVSEGTGTFLLLTSILFTGHWLIIGLTLAGIIYITGNLSGGHMNPAVSLAMYFNGKMTGYEFVAYSLSQFMGAAVGLLVFKHFSS